jgi:hypothetical protein
MFMEFIFGTLREEKLNGTEHYSATHLPST